MPPSSMACQHPRRPSQNPSLQCCPWHPTRWQQCPSHLLCPQSDRSDESGGAVVVALATGAVVRMTVTWISMSTLSSMADIFECGFVRHKSASLELCRLTLTISEFGPQRSHPVRVIRSFCSCTINLHIYNTFAVTFCSFSSNTSPIQNSRSSSTKTARIWLICCR